VPEWTADFVVDEALVRRLLRQFPELAAASVRPFAEGWDYAIWLVDETWAVRFPRREIAVPGVEVEIAVLPKLAPLLPVPVPAAELVGEPTEEFPWPFFASRLLPGRELGDAELDDAARVRVASTLGEFLRRLHDTDVPDALPVDANRRADMASRVPAAREQLELVAETGLWEPPSSVEAVFEAAEQLPSPETCSVVHGDLHFRQVLVDDDGVVTGVIDWVDLGRSDAGIDLSLYWSYFPQPAREAFLEAYGDVTAEQLLRARVLALNLSAILARYGAGEGNDAVRNEAVAGLARAASP
jgi:aminoglycoside phosphotransferase (APT) family kinase protein